MERVNGTLEATNKRQSNSVNAAHQKTDHRREERGFFYFGLKAVHGRMSISTLVQPFEVQRLWDGPDIEG